MTLWKNTKTGEIIGGNQPAGNDWEFLSALNLPPEEFGGVLRPLIRRSQDGMEVLDYPPVVRSADLVCAACGNKGFEFLGDYSLGDAIGEFEWILKADGSWEAELSKITAPGDVLGSTGGELRCGNCKIHLYWDYLPCPDNETPGVIPNWFDQSGFGLMRDSAEAKGKAPQEYLDTIIAAVKEEVFKRNERGEGIPWPPVQR